MPPSPTCSRLASNWGLISITAFAPSFSRPRATGSMRLTEMNDTSQQAKSSFSGISESEEVTAALNEYMPLFGKYYDIPFADLEKISMPCINIGPWGKDFHKLTERVYKPDLYERTPAILDHAIRMLLK